LLLLKKEKEEVEEAAAAVVVAVVKEASQSTPSFSLLLSLSLSSLPPPELRDAPDELGHDAELLEGRG